MGQLVRFQEILRRLTMIDEGFIEDQAVLGLGLTSVSALDARTAALLRLGASVAIGAPGSRLRACERFPSAYRVLVRLAAGRSW